MDSGGLNSCVCKTSMVLTELSTMQLVHKREGKLPLQFEALEYVLWSIPALSLTEGDMFQAHTAWPMTTETLTEPLLTFVSLSLLFQGSRWRRRHTHVSNAFCFCPKFSEELEFAYVWLLWPFEHKPMFPWSIVVIFSTCSGRIWHISTCLYWVCVDEQGQA